MLQAIRSKATSLVVKLLFGALIVSFGIWGIGDIFRNRGVDTSVATVGSRKIDAQELNQEAHKSIEELQNAFRGAPIDVEQLKQHGLVEDVLQRIVDRDLIELEVDRLRLAVGDDTVIQAIRANPAFQNADGNFDPQIFKAQLARERKSEAQLQASVNADLVRSHLVGAVIAGVAPPAELVDTLAKLRGERRVAEIAAVPMNAAGTPPAPSDADLAAAYEQHKAAFRVPELRSFTVGVLRIDDVAQANRPSDESLHDEYEAQLSKYTTPEQRRLQQILLPDEAKAKQAADALASGKDFAQVAKDAGGTSADALDLGFFTRDDLPPKLGDAAFALKLNEATQPIQDELGWHILRVSEIKPEETKPFDAVKDEIAKEMARDKAGDEMAKTANAVDDKIAGGATFSEVVESFGLKTTQVENVDANGRDSAGKSVELPEPSADILRTAFGTEGGQTSEFTEMGESGYFLVQVDKVTPETFKPAQDVHAQLVALWQADWRDQTLEKLAKEIAEQVNGGRKLDDVAATHKFTVTTSQPLQRSGGDATVPPAAVAKVFQVKPGTAVAARGDDGYVVAVVKDVLPPDPQQEGAAAARLAQQLTPSLQEDLFQQFDRALRDRYPVTVNPDAVARAF